MPLNRATGRQDTCHRSSGHDAMSQTRRILLVSPDLMVTSRLAAAARECGASIETVRSLDEPPPGLAPPYDIALIDLQAHGDDPAVLVARVRSLLAGLPSGTTRGGDTAKPAGEVTAKPAGEVTAKPADGVAAKPACDIPSQRGSGEAPAAVGEPPQASTAAVGEPPQASTAAVGEPPQASTAARLIAFGPHVHRQRLDDALAAGADEAISRGELLGSFPALVRRWSH